MIELHLTIGEYDRKILGDAFHNALKGTPAYINNEILLNIDGNDENGNPEVVLLIGNDNDNNIILRINDEFYISSDSFTDDNKNPFLNLVEIEPFEGQLDKDITEIGKDLRFGLLVPSCAKTKSGTFTIDNKYFCAQQLIYVNNGYEEKKITSILHDMGINEISAMDESELPISFVRYYRIRYPKKHIDDGSWIALVSVGDLHNSDKYISKSSVLLQLIDALSDLMFISNKQ